MDKVRFGRALGRGARGAAKSLWEAASAAAAADPAGKGQRTAGKSGAPQTSVGEVVGSVVQAHRVMAEGKQQVRKAGMSAVAPTIANAKRLGGVLWLEVTGTFFAIFAMFLGGAMWKSRGALRMGMSSPEAHRLLFHVAVFVVFAYFAASSFVRAKKRERR